MSHYMTALAMRQVGLKPATKIVLYWIADHHNEATGKCFPSHKRLAQLCEMTDRSIRTHIEFLINAGLLTKHDNYRDNGSQTSNSYSLHLMDTDNPRKNIPTPLENISDPPQKNLPTLNLGNNNLGIEPLDHVDLDFDRFYEIYPRKIGKGAAKTAFAKAIKKKPAQLIIEAAHEYLVACKGKDKKFIPHPATWLNQERWDDEIEFDQGSIDTEFRLMVTDLARLR